MIQFLWVLIYGCTNPEKEYTYQDELVGGEVDPDQDGYFGAEDCDETSPAIHSGAAEICDGVDNNCDGQVDEGVLTTYYFDGDGDNFGDSAVTEQNCFPVEGYVTNGNDCNDEDGAIYPGAMEVCDEIDNDCNALIDDGLGNYWFFDEDGDGYGSINTAIQACAQPEGSMTTGGDCDDENAQIFPGVDEECDGVDNNCNGQIDESGSDRWYRDADGDGFGNPSDFVESCIPVEGYIDNNLDCDDADSFIHPDSVEICDGVDNNCNGILNENAIDGYPWFEDSDMDGYGNPAVSMIACTQPIGFSSNDDDCDDTNVAISPAALEFCNEIDDDCDGVVDDSDVVDFQVFFADLDGDGFGDSASLIQACEQGTGMVSNNQDCDDGNASIYPYATEVCNGLDDNCNTVIDEGAQGLQIYYQDNDGDGFGSGVTQLACSGASGFSEETGDCDDSDAAINPDAVEVCDFVDNDCDGTADENFPISAWYEDSDNDGFGSNTQRMYHCQQPAGYIALSGDCDDVDAAIHPNATELCDFVDNDCDGGVDEGIPTSLWFLDGDSDGFGTNSFVQYSCQQPPGYTSSGGDCDDGNAVINPNNVEVCNLQDDDCDGSIDEGFTTTPWYEDADGDGVGANGSVQYYCQQPSGFVSTNGDCDDSDASINPSVSEVCNLQDDNCDGSIDEGLPVDPYYIDADSDGFGNDALLTYSCQQLSGYVADGGDCDDGDLSINPNANEVCNAVDDDCNGNVDEGLSTTVWYRDSDGDGFGNDALSTYNCQQPSGYVSNNDDCEDGDALINPNGVEICNGLDDDCDNSADAGFLGRDLICLADSCADILAAHPNAADGEYMINFPSGVEQTECDMGSFGGGWTQVFMDDMSPPDQGWTLQDTYECGIWGEILGGYGIISGPNPANTNNGYYNGMGEVENTISTRSIPHTEVWVEFDYIALDSWDFSGQPGLGPDFGYAYFNNTYILEADFDNHVSIYGEVCGWDRGYYGSYDSRLYVSRIQYGTFANFTLRIGSTLNQHPWDESFGFDDVYVWVR